jgi:hypothetical protein
MYFLCIFVGELIVMILGETLGNKIFDSVYKITYREVRDSVKDYTTVGLMWSTQNIIYTPIHLQTYNLIYWNVVFNIINKYDEKKWY